MPDKHKNENLFHWFPLPAETENIARFEHVGFLVCYSTVFHTFWRWRATDRDKHTIVHSADIHTNVSEEDIKILHTVCVEVNEWR